MNKKLIAVYGSLRKDLHNHNSFLRNADFIGEFKTEAVYSLYDLGSFPGLKNDGNTSVVMEIYAVTEKEGINIDHLEGYDPNRKSTFYDKESIETPFGEASVYTYVRTIPENKLVESGDWKEHVISNKNKILTY
jgi:gamma-glutamylcyclotransferase (GGCT)/AIG2-like uncharacterized protein YtfP